MTFEDTKNGVTVTIDRDCIKIIDHRKRTSTEYRGQVPGGLACSGYAEQILQARALEAEAMAAERRAG